MTAKSYKEALEMIERLIDTDDDNPQIDVLAKQIADYENTAPEFAEFNARIASLDSKHAEDAQHESS